MSNGFNLSKEKVTIPVTQTKDLTVEDALKTYDIEMIEFPFEDDGSIRNITNGFCGNIIVKYGNNKVICPSLMRSQFEGSRKWYIPEAKRARLYSKKIASSMYVAIGNTVKGAERRDGTQTEYASTFIPEDELEFIRQYVNMVLADVEYNPNPRKQNAQENQAAMQEGESAIT